MPDALDERAAPEPLREPQLCRDPVAVLLELGRIELVRVAVDDRRARSSRDRAKPALDHPRRQEPEIAAAGDGDP